jgi:hypothetical protein
MTGSVTQQSTPKMRLAIAVPLVRDTVSMTLAPESYDAKA